jgi:cytochrome d ubiquinol oxidase subunit I
VSASHAILAALAPGEQQHLLDARQMQALSFAVHIPLVAFGTAFPAMVLFCEWLSHRSCGGWPSAGRG